jgi:biopolymer transport protein ExbD
MQRFSAPWLKPFSVAASWLTVLVSLLMLYMASGTFTAARGVVIDLPHGDAGDGGEATEMVALVMPTANETLVFFDDARYVLGDASSVAALADHLAERVSKSRFKTLMVLADRQVHGGELMKIASLARSGGVSKILFAEKRRRAAGE